MPIFLSHQAVEHSSLFRQLPTVSSMTKTLSKDHFVFKIAFSRVYGQREAVVIKILTRTHKRLVESFSLIDHWFLIHVGEPAQEGDDATIKMNARSACCLRFSIHSSWKGIHVAIKNKSLNLSADSFLHTESEEEGKINILLPHFACSFCFTLIISRARFMGDSLKASRLAFSAVFHRSEVQSIHSICSAEKTNKTPCRVPSPWKMCVGKALEHIKNCNDS